MVGDFNTPLLEINIRKIQKRHSSLNNTINDLALIIEYRDLHPKTIEYFFHAHGTPR